MIDDIESVKRIALNPGDVVVVTVQGRLPMARFVEIKALVAAAVGPGHNVIVLDSYADLSVLGPDRQAA